MKIYMVSQGKPNTGYECSIKCIFFKLELAEQIVKAFTHECLVITEFEVIE